MDDIASSTKAIRLSPAKCLHIDDGDTSSVSTFESSIIREFNRDFRAGWFLLGANKSQPITELTWCFWHDIAAEYITRLCHVPPEEELSSLPLAEKELIEKWVLSAPPMRGGEYLSTDTLIALLHTLHEYVIMLVKECGGVHSFLEKHAPDWHQVGRVSFHLAENKHDYSRPFAFLATYSIGLGAKGQLKHLPLKEALKQYAGEKNRALLVKLLTPVQMACQRCSWVKELVDNGQIYQPLAWSANKAYTFLTSASELEASGLTVRIPNWWKKRFRPQLAVTIDSKKKTALSASAMLEFNVGVALGDETLTDEELQQLLHSDEKLISLRGQWVHVDRDKLQEALKHWKEIQKMHKSGQMTFADGMRLLAGAPSELTDSLDAEVSNEWMQIRAGDRLQKMLHEIRNPAQMTAQTLTTSYTLRPYQQEGVSWMSLLANLGLGACLADDMGLGKTIQVLTLLALQKRKNVNPLPSLLVVPASLLSNWQNEAKKFTPELQLFLLHPSMQKNKNNDFIEQEPSAFFAGFDLVVTTYSMVNRFSWLKDMSWQYLILDEAQAIKNAGTQQAKAVKALTAASRIALTGTPVENRLSDLWSLFDFLQPGLLGTAAYFKRYVASMEKESTLYESLRKLTAPYILRRMKTDPKVISDLPEKIETQAFCALSKTQVRYYQSVVDELARALENSDDTKRRGIVLRALMQLKQICNHPSQYLANGDYEPADSGKFERLRQICEELSERQEKVLVFTQFSEIIPHLEAFLSTIFGRRGLTLDGSTPIRKRKEYVEHFQKEDGPPFFVLSLKAGGTGLTLTQAEHVVHFDRWWNPAVENQATDRAFRIGQKSNVQVHTFITQATVEDKIDAIIASKKALSQELLASKQEVDITALSNDELITLVSLDIEKVNIK